MADATEPPGPGRTARSIREPTSARRSRPRGMDPGGAPRAAWSAPSRPSTGSSRGRKAISGETALGLERVLGTPARVWLNLQSTYGLVRARLAGAGGARTNRPSGWSGSPSREMARRGWIEQGGAAADRVRSLLQFFGLQSFSRWDESRAAPGFRLSPEAKADRYALHAWVRRGEIEGRGLPAGPYDEARFRGALAEIRGLTAERDFLTPMRELCASAGVALVAVRELPKTGAQGVARWLTPRRALIQVNTRYRWADTFWFAFFHEAGHVLAHRRKDVFVDVRSGMERGRAGARGGSLRGRLPDPAGAVGAVRRGEAPHGGPPCGTSPPARASRRGSSPGGSGASG